MHPTDGTEQTRIVTYEVHAFRTLYNLLSAVCPWSTCHLHMLFFGNGVYEISLWISIREPSATNKVTLKVHQSAT